MTRPKPDVAPETPPDSVWSDYLEGVGRSDRRLFQGTKLWNSLKQVIRSNDRMFGQRMIDRDELEADDERATHVLLDEINLFLQGQLMGPSAILLRDGITAGAVERSFAEGADAVATTLGPGRATTVDLPAGVEITGEAICLENRTERTLAGCRLVVNDRSFRDAAGIARTLIGADPDALTPPERAHALLTGFRETVGHCPRQIDRKRDPLARNPVAFLNYFGQSTCGVIAHSFAALAESVGLTCRVRRNAAHTFPEVHLDGAWRIMDPDPACEPFYPALERPRELLGAEALWECDPRAHARVKLPSRGGADDDDGLGITGRKRKRTAAFTSRERTKLVADGADLVAEMRAGPPVRTGFTMHPGEVVVLGYAKGGPWYAAALPVTLPPRERPVMVREVDLLAAGAIEASDAHGLETRARPDGTPVLTTGSRPGRLLLPLDDGFPLLDASVDVGGEVDLGLDVNGVAGPAIVPARVGEDGTRHFRLRRDLFRATPTDRLVLRIDVPAGAEIDRLRLLLTCQVAACALPDLRPGPNRVVLETDAGAPPDAACPLRIHYRTGPARSVPLDIVPADPPMDGVVDRSLPALSWRLASGEPVEDRLFRVIVAHDPALRVPVAGNLDRTVRGGRLGLDDDDRSFLEPGRRYHWRAWPAGDGFARPDRSLPPFTFDVT
jgi:hypothetical protein